MVQSKQRGLMVKGEVVGRLGIEYETLHTTPKNYTDEDVKDFRNGVLEHADNTGVSREETKVILQMLGFLPYMGHSRDSRNKYRPIHREPYFDVT